MKILIADSSLEVARLCQHLIRLHGHSATVACGLEEAIAARRERLFDVYLIDLDFLDCGGPALLGALRRAEGHGCQARAVGWTAAPDAWRASPSVRLFDVFLTKPASLRTLLAALEDGLCPECLIALSERYLHVFCQLPRRGLWRFPN